MRVILSIDFDSDSLTLTYMTLPEDMRQNGSTASHRITVRRSSDYVDEIEALTDAVSVLLEDALEDFANVPAYVADEGDDEDD